MNVGHDLGGLLSVFLPSLQSFLREVQDCAQCFPQFSRRTLGPEQLRPWVLLTDFSPLLCTVPHARVPSEAVRGTSPASAGGSLDSFSSRPPDWHPVPVLGEDPRLSCRAGRTPPQGPPGRYSDASRMR